MPKFYAQIVLPFGTDKEFTYSVPPSLRGKVKVGSRVLVPLGRQTTTGIVVDLVGRSSVSQIKDILDLLDPEPLFDANMVALTRWISEYYLCSWGDAFKAALPAELRRKGKKLIRLREPYAEALARKLRRSSPLQAEIVKTLVCRGEISDTALARRVGREGLFAALHQLQSAGHLQVRMEIAKPRVGVRTERAARLLISPEEVRTAAEGLQKRAPKQAAGLKALLQMGGVARAADLSRERGKGVGGGVQAGEIARSLCRFAPGF
jgi:primosomal protein N' (replication factor Y)